MSRTAVKARRVACDLLFCRWRFASANDVRQAAQRTVYCFSIRKDFRYVRFLYDDIASPRIASRVLSPETFFVIVLSHHLVVFFLCLILLHSAVLVCSLLAPCLC